MIATAILLLLSATVHAGERPAWTVTAPNADGTYKYYVGRALEEGSEREAWRVAKDQAQELAIRENFGVETSIASSSFESAKEVALDRRVSELFPKVRLVDFQLMNSFVEEKKGRHSVWILFRYPIKQIELESARLKTTEPDLLTSPFNEIGGGELRYSTTLEVTSDPNGIPVFIDSERWGVTPLRIAGALPPGVHKLQLSHANYQDVSVDVVLTKGGERKVHQRMKAAAGYLKVEANPPGAEVIIEGIAHGSAPVGPIPVSVSRPKKVEVRMPGYETQIQMIEIEKDESRTATFDLNPVRRNLSSTAATAKGDHRNAWIGGLFLGASEPSAPKGYGLSTVMLGITWEKRFLWFFGLRAGLSMDIATDDSKSSNQSGTNPLEGSGKFIGLPIYLTKKPKGFYLMPEYGAIKHKRLIEKPDDAGNSNSYEREEFMDLSAKRKGLRLGYMNLNSHVDVWAAVHEYDWREQGKVQAASVGITFTLDDGGK